MTRSRGPFFPAAKHLKQDAEEDVLDIQLQARSKASMKAMVS